MAVEGGPIRQSPSFSDFCYCQGYKLTHSPFLTCILPAQSSKNMEKWPKKPDQNVFQNPLKSATSNSLTKILLLFPLVNQGVLIASKNQNCATLKYGADLVAPLKPT